MIKYKILSDSAYRWAHKGSTSKEIWEVLTDGSTPRSSQLLSEMLEYAAKDDLAVEILTHFDEYVDESKMSIAELRKTMAYLILLKKCLGSSDRTKLCVHEAFYTKIGKLASYCKTLEDILHEGTMYSATVKKVINITLDIGSILRNSDIDVWTKVKKCYFTKTEYPIETKYYRTNRMDFLTRKLINFYCNGLGWSDRKLDEYLRSNGVITPKMYGWDTHNFKREGIDKVEDYFMHGTHMLFDKRGLVSAHNYNRMLLFQRQ